jgi:hypothetical protein
VIGAYASAAIVCAASVAVGQAVLSLCGRREFTWLSGPLGLAGLLVVSGVAIRLPGHGMTVAIVLAVLLVASLGALIQRGVPWSGRALAPPLAAAILALLAASIPFIANGRIGVLGQGLVNDDMAYHLLMADWLNTRVGEMPVLIHQGYPTGPHALAAGLSEGLHMSLIRAFASLTLAIPTLTALVAFEALRGIRTPWRIGAAALVALPYLVTAYLAQEAFKEPMMALFLLAFALLLPTTRSRAAAIPLGVLAAGSVYAYSFPGLFWLGGTAAIWLFLAGWGRRGRGVRNREPSKGRGRGVRQRDPSKPQAAHAPPSRRVGLGDGYLVPAVTAGVAIAVLLVLTAPEWGRIIEFTHFRAFRSETISGGLGNLHHQLSPLEAFGVWPTSEFRLSAGEGSLPAIVFYAGALLGAAAFALGLPRWIRRNGHAIPAATVTAIAIYVGARVFGTVYTSGKALAIGAPLIMLIALGGLLVPGDRRRWRTALTAAFIVAAALSSVLILRQAPVGPDTHRNELAELRPMVQGQKVLFLGRDNFVSYELRGSRPFTAVQNFYDPNFVKPNLRLHNVFEKFDFDSVTPRTLARFPYVITTRAAYASGPPPAYRPVRETPDFVLWKRSGAVGPRRTLDEGDAPGAVLHCGTTKGRRLRGTRGTAEVFPREPMNGATWSPGSTVSSGSPVTQTLRLPKGRWALSLQYDSTRPLTVSAPGLDQVLPANLDYRGSVPFYPAGTLQASGGAVRLTLSVERPPLAGRIMGTKAEAHLGAIAATPAGHAGKLPGDGERTVPLGRACGRYVDWYARR